uniref:Uncharacterized protein n=1 Tax=Aegilops tauschii TaxID=37682 RepID=N1QWX5_AEGTA
MMMRRRVMCLVQCRMNILLVFSSSDGQWRSLPFYQWRAPEDELFDLPPAEDGLFTRQFVHGRFCWRLLFLNKLVLLDPRTMESSALNLPPQLGWGSEFVIVEAAQGMFGMLRKVQDRRSEDDDTYLLTYSSLRNNKWHLEKVIPLPVKGAALLSVGAGYLLIGARPYTRSSHEKPKFELLSVDVKTLQIELFAELSEATLPDQLYVGFPPSLLNIVGGKEEVCIPSGALFIWKAHAVSSINGCSRHVVQEEELVPLSVLWSRKRR